MRMKHMSYVTSKKWIVAGAIAIAAAVLGVASPSPSDASGPPQHVLDRLPASAVAVATEEARAAVEDGWASEGEYVAAMAREQACMRASLPTVAIPDAQWDEGGLFLAYEYEVVGEEAHLAALEVEESCQRHRAIVEMVWSESLVPNDAVRAQIAARVVACLASRDAWPAGTPNGSGAVIDGLATGQVDEVDVATCVAGRDRILFLAPRG